jgi:hypothetical protein
LEIRLINPGLGVCEFVNHQICEKERRERLWNGEEVDEVAACEGAFDYKYGDAYLNARHFGFDCRKRKVVAVGARQVFVRGVLEEVEELKGDGFSWCTRWKDGVGGEGSFGGLCAKLACVVRNGGAGVWWRFIDSESASPDFSPVAECGAMLLGFAFLQLWREVIALLGRGLKLG